MESLVIPSTLLLTILLAVGLFFFIRASVKDRIETVRLLSDRPDATLKEQLRQYFFQRAYRIAQLNPEQNQVVFEGVVAPSLFLAIFLSVLAALGFLCLGLVLSMALNTTALFTSVPVLLSPLAGWFYWSRARRLEQVILTITELNDSEGSSTELTVTAHRNELADLQRLLNLKPSA
ncbi:MAG: cofactor assembly of complex C subunit B [Cyanobacteria bacterium]|nr:cofactor assembly of complex C subunit B [Cyanobacteriota bacterium]MDW8202212.1 cofactor assembly of complex C subunit B [Cyanobacteriota bacterium SKYGB_h_bin112]